MAYLDKTTKTYTGRVRLKGYPQKLKKGFRTKTEALKWEMEEKERLKAPQEQTPMGFLQCANNYLDYTQKRLGKNTYRDKRRLITSLIDSIIKSIGKEQIKTLPIDNFPKKYISEYLDQRYQENGSKSANRDLREIKTLFNWFAEEEYFLGRPANPAKHIRKYAEEEFIKYVPPPEDVKKIFLAAENDDYDFISVIYYTLARTIEVRRLQWERDIDFKYKTVQLWTKKRKDGSLSADIVDMPNVLYKLLQKRYKNRNKQSPFVFCNDDGEQFSKNKWDNVMPKLCKRAGVKKFGFHALRHHGARILLESGLSLREIQEQLRHRRTTTTDVYLTGLVKQKSRTAQVLGEEGEKITIKEETLKLVK